MPELTGLDVYEGQGVIDWPAVPDLTFVCAKATQWRADRFFARNWSAMRERGFLVRGAYHFVTTEPASVQARRFRDTVGELLPGEVPALDYEPAGSIPVLGASFACEVRDAVEDAFGREVLIYIGYSYPGAAQIIDGRPWWFPSYGISEAGARAQALRLGLIPHVWQWGGGAHGTDVPGVTPGARDDSNQVLRPSELIAWAGSAARPAPTRSSTRRNRTMDQFTNLLGLQEWATLTPDGVLVNKWETAGQAELSEWNRPLGDFAFSSLGEFVPVGDELWAPGAAAPEFGMAHVTVVLRSSGVGQEWSVHNTDDLRRFLASSGG